MASWIRKISFSLLLLIAGGIALWFWGSLKFVYSHGDRAGYIQKFSQKGWVFKTWEGELAMVTLPGSIPEKFLFTVRDPAAVAKVQELIGKRVVIIYEEHKALPGNIFGDTSYFVKDAKTVEDMPLTPLNSSK